MGSLSLTVTIDVGGTSTKVTVFDEEGTPLAHTSRATPLHLPHDGWVERDMDELWSDCVASIRDCLESITSRHDDISAVAVVGHSDGLYPIGADLRPTRQAIMATDTRAVEIVREWQGAGVAAEALTMTGTEPFPSSVAPLLAWLVTNESAALDRTRWFLSAKDWIRLRLTGEVGTEPTDASSSFLDSHTRDYSEEALALYSLKSLREHLPPIHDSAADIAGPVTDTAHEETGIPKGTPVIVGCHDVDAGAIGLDAITVGQTSILAGTFSINQQLVDTYTTGASWQLRPFVTPSRWIAMATSPTSMTNRDWWMRTTEATSRLAPGTDLEGALDIVYLPYLASTEDGGKGGASMSGLTLTHTRDDLLASVLIGIASAHRYHLESLDTGVPIPQTLRVGGGATRDALFVRILASMVGRSLEIGDGSETSRGAFALAGLATQRHATLADAAHAATHIVETIEPDRALHDRFDAYYDRYLTLRSRVLEEG